MLQLNRTIQPIRRTLHKYIHYFNILPCFGISAICPNPRDAIANASDVVSTGGVRPARGINVSGHGPRQTGSYATLQHAMQTYNSLLYQNAGRLLNNTLVSSSSLPEFRLCEYNAACLLSYHKHDQTDRQTQYFVSHLTANA